jgi:integrase/recombinase XerD
MSDLSAHLDDYLRLRRALGFKLVNEEIMLRGLAGYLKSAGASTITTELAMAWARLPQGVQPIDWAHRLSAARSFARYLATIDPATQVPPRDALLAHVSRPTPYLWSAGDVRRLLQAARALRPPLRGGTYEALFGLVAASGMRISEATGLPRADTDLNEGVITITGAKFGRDRLVPLHPSTTDALRAYAARRDELCPQPKTLTFFVSAQGTTLGRRTVNETFEKLCVAIGVRTDTRRPRIHDLRHGFAVRTLVDWYRSDLDVDSRMVLLSNYMGHVKPAGTYWYLSAVPELMELAAARLGSRTGGRP